MTHQISHSSRIPFEASGQRFDQIVAQMFPDYSRSRLQEWIKGGQLTLAGKSVKPHIRVVGGEEVKLSADAPEFGDWLAEPIPLNIVYEDEALLVINKPTGLVVHPAAGNYSGTLLNGLLHYLPNLKEVPRAGIVHRLDKDTTGLMVVAKNIVSQANLVAQLQDRSVSREYVALAQGVCPLDGSVNAAIGRDSKNRKKMAVVRHGGKEALTHFRLLQRLGPLSLLRLKLETGRTHQIRVHMAHLGFPLVGDATYGKKLPKTLDLSKDDIATVNRFERQALHAERLALIHPSTATKVSWRAPWPKDFTELVASLGGDIDRA